MDEDASQKQIEEDRKTLEGARQALDPSLGAGSTTDSSQTDPSPAQKGDTAKTEKHSYQKQIETYSLWTDTQLAVRFGEAGQYVKELCATERKQHGNWARRSETALELRENREKYARFLLRDLGRLTESRSQIAVAVFRDAIAAEFRDLLTAGVTRSDMGATSELTAAENAEKTTQIVRSKSSGARERFTHSEDYRSVTLDGETYTLTERQAHMIQILHEAETSGNAEVSTNFILEKLETRNSRWQDTWKTNPDAKKALLKEGQRKGTLRLNV